MRVGVVGAQGDGVAQHFHALIGAPVAVVEYAELIGGLGIRGVQAERALQQADGLGIVVVEQFQAPQRGQSGHAGGVGGEHGLEQLLGLRKAAAAVFDQSFDQMGLGRVGFGAPQQFGGAVHVSRAGIGVRQGKQNAGVLGIQLVRGFEFREGAAEVAALGEAESEQLVGSGLIGIGFQKGSQVIGGWSVPV